MNENIDYIDLMEHLIDEKGKTVELEREIVTIFKKSKLSKGSDVDFEDVKFRRDEKRQNSQLGYFMDTVSAIIYDEDLGLIETLHNKFEKKQIQKEDLFFDFEIFFGKLLVFKYFYYFLQTFKDKNLQKILEDFLQKKLAKLWFRQKNVILNIYTKSEFFARINLEVSTNAIDRIRNLSLSLKKKYQINRDRLFQLVGSLKSIDVDDFFRFKYLSNFLFSPDSKAILQRAIFVPENKFQTMLVKISNIDLLIISFYLNFGITRFEKGVSGIDGTKINPNLLKVFLKPYPEFSKNNNYDLVSEDEDYNVVETENDSKTEFKEITHKIVPKFQNNFSKEKKIDQETFKKINKSSFVKEEVGVFGKETNLIEMKFDFPSINEKGLKKTDSAIGKGWGKEQTILYTNESIKRKAMEEEFPELKDSQEDNILGRMNKKSESKTGYGKFIGFEGNVGSKFNGGDVEVEGERNILSVLKKEKEQANVNPMLIMKKKKEKKK